MRLPGTATAALCAALLVLSPGPLVSAGREDFARAQALWKQALEAAQGGRIEEAIRGLREAVLLYRSAGDPFDEAGSLTYIATLERNRQPEEALRDFTSAIEVAHTGGYEVIEASCRALLAITAKDLGRYQQAESEAEAALPILRARKDSRNVLVLLEHLGQIELELGRPAKAVSCFEEARALRRELGEKERLDVLLHDLALAYKGIGRSREALPLLQEALRSAQAQGDIRAQAGDLNGLGSLYNDLGDDRQALKDFEQAEGLYRSIGEKKDLWTVRSNIAKLYVTEGRYAEASAIYEEAIQALRKQPEQQPLAAALNSLGVVYRHLGKYREGLEKIQESLALDREMGNWAGVASALSNLATLELDLGHYERALADLEESLTLRRKAGDRQGEAVTLTNSAYIYVETGHHEEALARFEKALEIAREVGDGELAAGNLRYIASLLAIDHPQVALARLDEALALLSALDVDRPEAEQATLKIKGLVLLSLGRREEALRQFDRARDLSQKMGAKCYEAEAWLMVGIGHMLSSQLAAARDSFERDLQISRNNHCVLFGEMALLALGGTYELLRQRDLALNAYREAATELEATLDEIHTDDLLAGLLGETATPYPGLARLLAESGEGAEAFAVAERARGRAFLRQMGAVRIDPRKGAAGELIAAERELTERRTGLTREMEAERRKPTDQQDQALLSRLAKEIDENRSRYETLLLRLKQSNPEYASLVHASPLPLAEVQKLLDGETTLVEYFLLDQETLAWVVERDAYHLIRLPIAGAELSRQVQAFRDQIAGRNAAPDLAAGLYQTLFAPLEPHVHHTRLWIVPHGALHFLPFGALATAPEHPLVEKYTLAYLPSASVLPFLLAKRKPAGGRMLAMGDPDGSLPHAAAEVRAIARLYRTEPLLGTRATESALYQLGPEAGLLHLAAHTVFDPARPLFSRISLARDAANDGALEVHEVFGLDLRRASLVVLSGCDTGRGRVDAGDDLVGLSRAFLYAGAPGVVTSLWAIDDEASAALMEGFYRHLRQGEPAAVALRAAQLEIRRQERWKSPYFWAAFSLTGG